MLLKYGDVWCTAGTNDDDPDFVAAEGILEWDHGDAQDKVFSLSLPLSHSHSLSLSRSL
jgi:hypothetical protein